MDTSVAVSPFPLLCDRPHHPLQNLSPSQTDTLPPRPAPPACSASLELTSHRTTRERVVPSSIVRLACSLSAVSSGLIASFGTSLLRLDNTPLCAGNHTTLIHLSVDGCLGYLSFWPGVNNAPVNIGVQTLFSGHVVVQWLRRVRLFATPWTAARQASLSFTVSQRLLKLISIELTF